MVWYWYWFRCSSPFENTIAIYRSEFLFTEEFRAFLWEGAREVISIRAEVISIRLWRGRIRCGQAAERANEDKPLKPGRTTPSLQVPGNVTLATPLKIIRDTRALPIAREFPRAIRHPTLPLQSLEGSWRIP